MDRTSSGSRPVTGTRPVCNLKAKSRDVQNASRSVGHRAAHRNASTWPRAADSALFPTSC